jgi:hypothetical protein
LSTFRVLFQPLGIQQSPHVADEYFVVAMNKISQCQGWHGKSSMAWTTGDLCPFIAKKQS